MIKKFSFFVILFALIFSACKNEKTNTSESTNTTPSVSAKPKGFYKHFKGTVDSFPVTMDLVQISDSTTDFVPYNFRGHYFYDKYQEPIGLYGELDSVGNIVLHEDSKQDQDIYFVGKIDATGSFSGVWQDTSTKRKLPFVLKETYEDGAVSLDFHGFSDSLKLWKNKANSPMASFDLEAFLPSKNVEAGIATFLKDKIFMGINNDSIEKSYASMPIESLQKAKRDTFYKYYLETMAEEKPDSTGELSGMLNHAESHSLAVMFNEKGLLSLGFSEYNYSGGAHGNYATMVSSYDLVQKKALKIKDVFLPGFEKSVNAALTKAVRKQFKMKSNEPLSDYLFDKTIKYCDNFCITKKGVLFLYNPYEIAAYAYGAIELYIPFEEVKSVVNPQFLQ